MEDGIFDHCIRCSELTEPGVMRHCVKCGKAYEAGTAFWHCPACGLWMCDVCLGRVRGKKLKRCKSCQKKAEEKGEEDGKEVEQPASSATEHKVGQVEEENPDRRGRCEEVLSEEKQGSGSEAAKGAAGDTEAGEGSKGRDAGVGQENVREPSLANLEEELKRRRAKAKPLRCNCGARLVSVTSFYLVDVDEEKELLFTSIGEQWKECQCHCCGRKLDVLKR